MGLTGGLIKWVITNNQSKIDNLNKGKINNDFSLKYGYLRNVCSKEDLKLIKEKFEEYTALEAKISAVNELTPPSSGEIRKAIKFQLFFNDIDEIIRTRRLHESLEEIEQKTQVISEKDGGDKKTGRLLTRIKDKGEAR